MLLYEIILDHGPFVVELLLCIEQRKQLQFIQIVHSIRFILSKHLLIINKHLLLYESFWTIVYLLMGINVVEQTVKVNNQTPYVLIQCYFNTGNKEMSYIIYNLLIRWFKDLKNVYNRKRTAIVHKMFKELSSTYFNDYTKKYVWMPAG